MAKKGIFGGHGSRAKQLEAQEAAIEGGSPGNSDFVDHKEHMKAKHPKMHSAAPMRAPEKLSRAIGKVFGEKDYK
jgi:hypothetical protein